jgi:hypothetical protein
MFVSAHRARMPRRRGRGTEQCRVLIYAPDPDVRRWVEHELFAEAVNPHVVDGLADVVTTLTLVPPPWPQILILDAAAIGPADLALLSTIRESGWTGSVISIGDPSNGMQRCLGVDVALPRTFKNEMLRTTIKPIVHRERPTIPIRRIPG